MGQDNRIFHEVPLPQERDQILADVANTQTDIFIKLSDSRTFLAKAVRFVPPYKLQVTYPDGPRPLIQRAIPVQFNCRDEKYFAQVYTQDTGTDFFLVIEGSLFKVQRRQSFRLKLPTDYPMKAEIFEINGHHAKDPVRVLDLSEGGCSILVSGQMGNIMGAYVGLNVKIGTRPAFTQYGRVRYSRSDKGQNKLGIQFDKDQKLNSELFNLTRDLYVELFSKWARRK